MQVVRHQREMWIDGPTAAAGQQNPPPAVVPLVAGPAAVNPTPLGYGFMDQHKQGMIRQWVENQSVQVRATDKVHYLSTEIQRDRLMKDKKKDFF